MPTIFTALCVGGAVYSGIGWALAPSNRGSLLFACLYVVLAAIEGWIAYRIYAAKRRRGASKEG